MLCGSQQKLTKKRRRTNAMYFYYKDCEPKPTTFIRVCPPVPRSPYLWAVDSNKGYWLNGYQYDRWGMAFKTYHFNAELKKYFKANKIKSVELQAYILNNLVCGYNEQDVYNIKTGGQRVEIFNVYYIDENGNNQYIYHNAITYEEATERGLNSLDKLQKKYGNIGEDLVGLMRTHKTSEVYDKANTCYSSNADGDD